MHPPERDEEAFDAFAERTRRQEDAQKAFEKTPWGKLDRAMDRARARRAVQPLASEASNPIPATMAVLKQPDRITLPQGLAVLQNHLPPEQAKARLRQAFVQKVFNHEPLFALEYDQAEIDWETGSVKLPRKPGRFHPTFHRAEFEHYFFGSPAMTSPITDAEIRGRLLKHFYGLRDSNDGWAHTSEIILRPESVSRRAIANVCQQLAEATYIKWELFDPPIEQYAIGRAKITGPGIDVVTGARVPTLDIRFPNAGERDVTTAPAVVRSWPSQRLHKDALESRHSRKGLAAIRARAL